jgi:tetratricopeptide (TPR) repeat protein
VLSYVQGVIASGNADYESHRWLAQYYHKRFEWAASLESARQALAINAKQTSPRTLAARALMRLSRLAEALEELDFLLKTHRKPIVPLQLKADVLVRVSRVDDAIALYQQALEYEPDHPLTSARLSYAYLLKGDIAGFHRLHEKRRNVKTFIESNKSYEYLNWNGELPIGGKLLVWSEVGLGVGQNILHMTFLKSLVELGLDVVFEVEPRLVELCRRSFPDITVVASDGELPAGITHHTPIGSLSRWFKPDLKSFETIRPFFLPDVEAVAAHRRRLQHAAGEGQLLVGISWTSNNPFVGDVKSVPLDGLLDAVGVPGVTLVNLQYGDHSGPIAEAEAGTGKRLMGSGIDNSNDLDGLAAVVAAMDLVVCIGHTTAHMAGAVGTPNFVLLPSAPFAHWLAEGERCIWYPASRLFRQAPIDEDWSAVLDAVGSAVAEYASQYDAGAWLSTTLLPGLKPESGHAQDMSPRSLRDAIQCFFEQGAHRSALTLIDRLPPDEISTDLEMLRGDLLALIGQWRHAIEVFESLKSDSPEQTRELDRKILSTNLAMYDLEAALPLARHLASEEPSYRLTTASILYLLRRYDESVDELRALSLALPQEEGISTLFGNILVETGAAERAQAFLAEQAAMTEAPEDYALLGRSLIAQDRYQEALAVLEKGVASAKHHPAANFWRTQARIRLSLVERTPLPPLLGDTPDVTADDVVIFFAADSSFFWDHGLVLIESAGRRSPLATCHVHVINPDAEVVSAIEAVRKLLPEFRLSYSFEHVDFEGCSDIHIRTYYASVRFVRLAEVFARSPAHYLCIDADGIVRSDVTAKITAHGDDLADASIYLRFDPRPHMSVLASASLWRPTRAAAQLLNEVGMLIGSTLETRESIWFLDQIVLQHVLRHSAGEDAIVRPLDITYLDWFFHDESLIWTGKGKRKSDNNRYKVEAASLSIGHSAILSHRSATGA